MSQPDWTDLVHQAHRRELSAEEERRLRELVEHSFEARLMNQLLSEFDRESRVQPGDDLLLARVNARVLGAVDRRPFWRRRFTMLLVAAAVLLPASLAGAWFGGVRPLRILEATRPEPRQPAPVKSSAPARRRATAKPRASGAERTEEVVATPEPLASSLEAAPKPAPSGALGRHHHGDGVATASELFTKANLLRRAGRSSEAAELYRQLLERHPDAREVGPTRLALAKYLQAKEPAQALNHYRALAARGGGLRAEALWGVAETAATLGDASLSTQALNDLIREFPDSIYAEVARAKISNAPR